jgi:hypothetical protein
MGTHDEVVSSRGVQRGQQIFEVGVRLH